MNRLQSQEIVHYFDKCGVQLIPDEKGEVYRPRPGYETGVEQLEYCASNLILLYIDKDTKHIVLKNLKEKLKNAERRFEFKGVKLMISDNGNINPEHTSKTVEQFFQSRLGDLEKKL